MRRTASEVLRNLQQRIAKLEKKSSNNFEVVNKKLKPYGLSINSLRDLEWMKNGEDASLYQVKKHILYGITDKDFYVVIERGLSLGGKGVGVFTDYSSAEKHLRNMNSSRKASRKSSRKASRPVVAEFHLRDLKKLSKDQKEMLKALIEDRRLGGTEITNVDAVEVEYDGSIRVEFKDSYDGEYEWYVAEADQLEEMALDSMEESMEYSKPRYISFNDYVRDYYVSDYNDDPANLHEEYANDADHLISLFMDDHGMSWEEVVSALRIDTRGLAQEALDMDGIEGALGFDRFENIGRGRGNYVAYTR